MEHQDSHLHAAVRQHTVRHHVWHMLATQALTCPIGCSRQLGYLGIWQLLQCERGDPGYRK